MFNQLQQEYEIIELPSKGLIYSKQSPLSSGKIELRYPTALDQNILLSVKLLKSGKAIDTFLSNLLLDKKINLGQLLLGDKNALIYAARILAYGSSYQFSGDCPNCKKLNKNVTVDLNEITNKEIKQEYLDLYKNQNEFQFKLPSSGILVKFKLITTDISNQIQNKISVQENLGLTDTKSMTIRLSQQIIQFNGLKKYNQIKNSVQKMRSQDSLALRSYINKLTPDIQNQIQFECIHCNHKQKFDIQLDENFFWPTDVV